MTMEELDAALLKLGLDVTTDSGKEIKDMIVGCYADHIMSAKMERCNRCWLRENKGCSSNCELYAFSNSNKIEATIEMLSRPNDIQLIPFIVMFVIPIYEKLTGETNTLGKIGKYFKRRWNKEYGTVDSNLDNKIGKYY